jgi:hypothetical protein
MTKPKTKPMVTSPRPKARPFNDKVIGELPANKVMTGGSIRPKARPAKKK